MKQETIEEAAKRLAKGEGYDTILGVGHIWIEGFEKGAQWQQEQDKNKHSEEEVLIILDKFLTSMIKGEKTGLLKQWFEQFKKK
jgi:hypothetical protein